MRPVAQSFLKQKRYAESIALLEKIVRDDKAPGLFRAHDYKASGLAFARTNQDHAAVLSYQQAVKLFFDYYGEENKEFLELYNEIALSQVRCQEYESAIDYFKKAIALETNDEKIFIVTNNLGEAYYSAGNFEMAKKTFEDNFAFLKSNISEQDYPEAYNYCRQKIKESTDRLRWG
jgi:tetratricopeptide (TPR) repeat protein